MDDRFDATNAHRQLEANAHRQLEANAHRQLEANAQPVECMCLHKWTLERN
jgi:hypothetical protein